MNLLDTFRRAVSILLAHPVPMLTLGVFAVVPQLLSAFGQPRLLAEMASIPLTDIVFATTVYASAKAASGHTPDAFESLRAVRDRLGPVLELLLRYLATSLLLALTIVGIPFAIRVLVRWFFGTQGVVLRGLDAKGAISLSCRIATGRWWRLAGITLLVLLLLGVPFYAGPFLVGRDVTLVARMLLSVITSPLLACFWTLLFLDLEQRLPEFEPRPLPVS